MSGKLKFTKELTWVTSTPVPYVPGPIQPVGTLTGAMASTNTIYTNILDVTLYDNLGLEVSWTGTPTGTISIMGSSSGNAFYSLTFDPILTQPAGSGGGYLINLNQFPWKYLMVQYTNASGTGVLTTYLSGKDLN
jgi:hypothetical protein